ncbi:hypothetical protein D1007_42128 [Hordeum vulgare]|nr:hypothetical protein D1007_42128 [Hordeum vulgare]
MATGARSTAVGASGGTAAASSSITTEVADGLHPVIEASKSTRSMATIADEAVAATVLADEAKGKGDEASHLTDGKVLPPFPLSLLFFLLSLAVLRA